MGCCGDGSGGGGGGGPVIGGGACIRPGTAHGEIVQWDVVEGCYVPVGAPSADGQVLVWDAGTAKWVARQVQMWEMSFAATQIPATAVTYLIPGGIPTSAGASVATESNGQDVLTRNCFVRRLTVIHQVASTGVVLTYTVRIEGASTALTISQNGNVAGEVQDAVNVISAVNLDRIGIRVDNPGPTLTTPRIIARVECFGFV